MSRAAASSQPIWQLTISTPPGLLRTCRTQQVGENSFQIGEGVLAILTQFLLDYANRRNEFKKTRDILNPGKFAKSGLSTIAWINILNIALGFPDNSLPVLRQVAVAHLGQSNLLRPAKSSLFPVIPIHPNQLIEAILHGDEKMVCDILNAAPKLLLKTGTATDYHGRTFTGTPLQAAIAVDDIAPNANSTGTVEIILEQLKQLDPNNYRNSFEQQAGELYKKNLRVYVSMQEKEIARLCKLGKELPSSDPEKTKINDNIKKAQANLHAYAEALYSNDLNTLFETHKKAQADNAFDFQPYVDAITNATQAELDDVMALINAKTPEETAAAIARTGVAAMQTNEAREKLFDQLTLAQKLNRFREKFVAQSEKEIIFNPNHILSGLKANEAVWDTLSHAQDQQYHKRTVIFSQLVGWAQRNAAEPIRQDIRQGTWYLIQENERRTRQSRFNTLDSNYSVVKNSLVDVSISGVVDGVGYKFGGAAGVARLRRWVGFAGFQYLCRTKTTSLQNLLCGERNQLAAA